MEPNIVYLQVFDAILADMQTEAARQGDAEIEHGRGDELLLELLTALSAREPRLIQQRIEATIDAWRRITKHYA